MESTQKMNTFLKVRCSACPYDNKDYDLPRFTEHFAATHLHGFHLYKCPACNNAFATAYLFAHHMLTCYMERGVNVVQYAIPIDHYDFGFYQQLQKAIDVAIKEEFERHTSHGVVSSSASSELDGHQVDNGYIPGYRVSYNSEVDNNNEYVPMMIDPDPAPSPRTAYGDAAYTPPEPGLVDPRLEKRRSIDDYGYVQDKRFDHTPSKRDLDRGRDERRDRRSRSSDRVRRNRSRSRDRLRERNERNHREREREDRRERGRYSDDRSHYSEDRRRYGDDRSRYSDDRRRPRPDERARVNDERSNRRSPRPNDFDAPSRRPDNSIVPAGGTYANSYQTPARTPLLNLPPVTGRPEPLMKKEIPPIPIGKGVSKLFGPSLIMTARNMNTFNKKTEQTDVTIEMETKSGSSLMYFNQKFLSESSPFFAKLFESAEFAQSVERKIVLHRNYVPFVDVMNVLHKEQLPWKVRCKSYFQCDNLHRMYKAMREARDLSLHQVIDALHKELFLTRCYILNQTNECTACIERVAIAFHFHLPIPEKLRFSVLTCLKWLQDCDERSVAVELHVFERVNQYLKQFIDLQSLVNS